MNIELKEDYVVEIDDVDFSSHMSLLGLARHMQNIAAHHAELLGMGFYKDGIKPQYYWVVSRVKYILNENLKWKDRFSLTTCIAGYDKLFGVRLFDIKDKDDKLIGHIIGEYLLIDIEKERPVRITGQEPGFERFSFKYEGEQLNKLALPDTIIAEEKRKARYSEIDVNGHMNNIQYIKWILDMLPLEVYKEQEIESLQINYNKSVMYQDKVKVVIGTTKEAGYRVAGLSLDGKTNYFTAHMTLRNREV